MICFRCSQAEETSIYAFRDCPVVAATWQQLHWDWNNGHTEEASMRHWLLHHLHKLDHHQMQQVVISLWAIWNERNKELHGEQRKPTFGL